MSREFFDELVQHNFSIFLQHACRFAALSAEAIDELADDCDWRELSANERLPWSTQLVLRHLERWSPPELLANPAVAWTQDLIEGYGRRLDWHYLCQNPELRLDAAFLERHAKRLNWTQLARCNRHLTPELRERVMHELKGDWPPAPEPVGSTLRDVSDPGTCPLDRSRPVSSLTAEEAAAHHAAINWYKLTPDLLDLTPEWLRTAGVWLHWGEPAELLYRRFIEPHLKPDFATQLREFRRERAGYYFVNGAKQDAWGMIPRLDLLACASESRDPVPARVSSYKEGPWRFFELHWVDEVHGENCLLIDRRLRPVLQAYQLGKHRFRELDVRGEQKKLPDWLLLEINNDVMDHVVWSAAPFFTYVKQRGWRSHHEIGAVSSKQEWQRLRTELPKKDFEHWSLLPSPLMLRDAPDLMCLEGRLLMSERVLQALRGATNAPLRVETTLGYQLIRTEPLPAVITAPVHRLALADPRDDDYRFFESKMQRLEASPPQLPDGYVWPRGPLGDAARRLGKIFPEGFETFHRRHCGKTYDAFTFMSASLFHVITGYESSHPETYGAVAVASDGCGDYLALLLKRDSDCELDDELYVFEHDSGTIRRFGLAIDRA
jgi:hypothetical protein